MLSNLVRFYTFHAFGFIFVLDMITDAGDDAPCLQRNVTCAGTSVTEKSKLLLRTLSTRRNALSLKFVQRRHVPPFPSNSKQNLKEIDLPPSSEGQVIRFLPLLAKDRTRSEAEPAALPFDVMQLLTYAIWQPKATFATSQFCKKWAITSPDPCSPTTNSAPSPSTSHFRPSTLGLENHPR